MKKALKVALITDYMTGFGGADRLLISLLKIFPQAVIFTSVFDKQKYPEITNEVRTTFLQKIKTFKRHINFLTPLAFENIDVTDFDIAISLSAGSSKGIITRVDQPHICIMLTPPRHQWDKELNARALKLKKIYSLLSIFISHYLRIWDITAIKRADHIISISKYIKRKTEKIYNRESKVIYPGVADFWFEKVSSSQKKEIIKKYKLPKTFLFTLSRLYDHKKIDWAIKAAIKTKENLVIAGEGQDRKYLEKIAQGHKNIIFLGFVNDFDARALHSLSKAFIFSSMEDFGYVVVEAQACGVPVLAFNQGGSVEIIEEGKTGATFGSISQLSSLISKKVWNRYNTGDIVRRAKKFREETFLKKFKKYLKEIYEKR